MDRYFHLLMLAWFLPSIGFCDLRYHVAVHGNDKEAGTSEKPFATLQRARDAVREHVAKGLKENVEVHIRAGTYRISKPLVFELKDSGTGPFSITYRAAQGAKPVISGGQEIKGWTKEKDGAWSTLIPEVKSGQWFFRELFVNGKRVQRARHPNTGFLRVEKVGQDRRTDFRFKAGDIPKGLELGGAELHFLHDWSTSRIKIKSIDDAARILTMQDPVGCQAPHYAMDHFEKQPRFALENANVFLDVPGEWFLDAAAGRLWYKARPEEDLNRMEVVAPFAKQLLVVRGDIDQEKHIENLHFIGLGFEHCAWLIPQHGFAAGQASFHEERHASGSVKNRIMIPPALEFTTAEKCSFQDGTIRNLGGSGISFGRFCRNNTIRNSVVSDIGANGLNIGETAGRPVKGRAWWQAATHQVASGNIVRHNLIERCGITFEGSVGVWVGLAEKTRIAQNEIRFHPYTGVSVGWMWRPTPTPCRENLVVQNHIHHVLQVLSDGGGIYTLGRQPGTRLEQNHIHDIPLNAGRAESNGMFLDEGTADIVIEGNVIYRTDRSPLRFHRADIVRVNRNVLGVKAGIPPYRYNATPEKNILKQGNIVISNEKDLGPHIGRIQIKTGEQSRWNAKP